MSNQPTPKGPWRHRALIGFFSIVLTVLLTWFLGFITSDIGRIPGPEFEPILEKYVTPDLKQRRESLEDELSETRIQIENQEEIQRILDTSTRNSQATMNQLVELHRHNLERQITPTADEQAALAESEQRFLANQRKFQEANESIAALSEKRRKLEADGEALEKELEPLRQKADDEYREVIQSHLMKTAAMKLAVLVPLLFIAAWLLKTRRSTPYAPIFIAFFAATFIQISSVIHECFPSQYFKYIAVAAAIIVVLAILRYLIRMMTSPNLNWLLKQYREAYQRHLCPVCSFPIQRGVFRQATWTSKGPKLHSIGSAMDGATKETPYSCPSCGSALYEKCDSCGEVRHSLLPYCESCGVESSRLAPRGKD